MERTAIYLRKSRFDEEIEKTLGEGETLAKHRKALLRYAKDKELNIVKIHEELVSGEDLFFRPEMLDLLKEVKEEKFDSVLCMDLQRLGRGDMEEQGLILKTLKESGIKIITPQKVYNLNDEFDEEYSEFEAFMSRKEYRMIKRRLQGGRDRSIQEGNYIATRPPYGYVIKDMGKQGRTLEPHPEQADIVKLIFNWYAYENKGFGKIAEDLNNMGVKSYAGIKWERPSVKVIIVNEVYIGKVCWKKKSIKKSKTPGKKRDSFTRPVSEWLVADGKHEPIIDQETFDRAQEILKERYHVPYQSNNGPTNAMAGLIHCGICGASLIRRPYKNREAHILCNKKCGSKSNKYTTVESAVLKSLSEGLKTMELTAAQTKNTVKTDELAILEANLISLERELSGLQNQRLKLHDLLEQGVYDINTFIERSKLLTERIENTEKSISETISKKEHYKIKNKSLDDFIKDVRMVVTTYWTIDDVDKRNMLLKSVLTEILYYKSKTDGNDIFRVELTSKMPEYMGF